MQASGLEERSNFNLGSLEISNVESKYDQTSGDSAFLGKLGLSNGAISLKEDIAIGFEGGIRGDLKASSLGLEGRAVVEGKGNINIESKGGIDLSLEAMSGIRLGPIGVFPALKANVSGHLYQPIIPSWPAQGNLARSLNSINGNVNVSSPILFENTPVGRIESSLNLTGNMAFDFNASLHGGAFEIATLQGSGHWDPTEGLSVAGEISSPLPVTASFSFSEGKGFSAEAAYAGPVPLRPNLMASPSVSQAERVHGYQGAQQPNVGLGGAALRIGGGGLSVAAVGISQDYIGAFFSTNF